VNVFDLVPMALIFAIPIVAILGGITKGIVKTNARQRLVEMAHRERLAALERGVDPSQLPPLEFPEDRGSDLTWEQRQHRRAHTLLVTGLAFLLGGLAFAIFLASVAPREGVWALGLVFSAVGIALLAGSWTARPRAYGNGSGLPGVPGDRH
jgi:hypothetical protein